MSTALYRTYRPQKFAEVTGQSAAVELLVGSLTRGRTAHAYLFSGPRGCGKTTIARLMAKAFNCAAPKDGYEPCCECESCVSIKNGDNMDVIEIDGASNNGVDEIRELKTHVALAPFNSKHKIYIIDEVHMLSTAAFNALLKTLEEPPAHVVFILATTEAHKVPVTIRSRCQHIPFHRISPQDISARLKHVCESENTAYDDEAIWEIARYADGALRDALSLLDQAISLGKEKLKLSDVEELLGGGSRGSLEKWFVSVRQGSPDSFNLLNDMFLRGAGTQRVLEELFLIARNLWVTRKWGTAAYMPDTSSDERAFLEKEAPNWEPLLLEGLMPFISKLVPQARLGLRSDVLIGLILAQMQRSPVAQPAPVITPPPAPVKKAAEPEPMSAPVVTPPPAPVKKAAEPEPTPAPVITPPPAPVKKAVEPERQTVPAQLRGAPEWYLDNVRQASFPVYCALLGVAVSDDGINCRVTTRDAYVFHMLSIERNASILLSLWRAKNPDSTVTVEYGSSCHNCEPVFPMPISRNAAAKAPMREPEEPDYIPDDPNAPDMLGEPTAQTAPLQDPQTDDDKALKLLKSAMQIRGELILAKRAETATDAVVEADTDAESFA